MVERVVTVRGRAAMGEYIASMNKAGLSTRAFASELKDSAAALELEAVKSRTAAAAAAKEARERAAAARAAGLAAKEKVAAAKSGGTAEAQAEATAAKTHAAASRSAALDAKNRAAAAKDLAIQADAAAAAAKRESAIISANAREHAAARESVARHTMVLGTGLVAAFGAAEYATLGFDKQMSAVGAASGAVSADLAALRDAAIAAGQATVFGAKDAAVAEEELAKAGVSVKDVLSGGLIGSLNLATAGNLDLGRAAEIAASTMTQFKLAGRDIPHIADLLAAGAGKAQGSVEDLGLAMTYVGPVAGQMGVSVEETTGALAELASNGILADKAGTGLRGVLMALTAPSAKAADTMKDLGINVYDSKGKFVGFRGVAEQLHRSLSGLSAQQRDVALGQIFGNEQIVAARVLYAGGAQAVDEWTRKVNDSGYAARFAAARMDNLAGDLEQLKGSIETALIKGGTGATDVLRKLAQAATGAVNAFSELPAPMQTAISAATAVTGGILLAGGAYGTLVPKLRTARRELEATGRAGMVASKGIGLLGKLGGIAAALGALAVGAQYLGDKLDGIPDPAILAQHLQDLFVEVASGQTSVRELANAFAGASRLIDLGGVSAKMGARQMAVLDQQMGDFARGDVKNAQKVMETLTDALGAQGFTAEQVSAMFPKYADAVKATQAQNVLTADSQDELSTSIAGTGAKTLTYTSLMKDSAMSTDSLAESTKSLKDEVSGLSDEFDFYIGRHVDLAQADSDWRSALMDAEKQLKDSKGSLDDWTKSGEANVQLFGDLIKKAEGHREAMVKDGSDTDVATAAFWRQIDSIRNIGIRSGISAADMDTLLGKMLGVGAAKVKPTIDANIKQAMANISAVSRALAALNGRIAKTYLQNFVENIVIPSGGGRVGMERGGVVGDHLPPAGASDTYGPLWLAPGEGILRSAAVDRIGGPAGVAAINAGRPVPVHSVGGGSAGGVSGGRMMVSLDPSDRALLRAVAALADRPVQVHAAISEREVYDANRRQTIRNQARR